MAQPEPGCSCQHRAGVHSSSFRQLWRRGGGEGSGRLGLGPQQDGRQSRLALGLTHGLGPREEGRGGQGLERIESEEGRAEAAALTCSPGCPAGPG